MGTPLTFTRLITKLSQPYDNEEPCGWVLEGRSCCTNIFPSFENIIIDYPHVDSNIKPHSDCSYCFVFLPLGGIAYLSCDGEDTRSHQ